MSSVNYDPVKAHEYYEKHKHLKGRKRSTKGWNQTQKEQLSYAKYQLSEQKKAQLSDISEQRKEIAKKLSEQKREQKKRLSEATQAKIKAVRAKLKNMPPAQKEQFKAQIQNTIDALKGELSEKKSLIDIKDKSAREELTDRTKSAREKVRENYEKGIDEAYKKIGG